MENNKKTIQEQITPKLDAISRSVYDQLKKNDFVRIVLTTDSSFSVTSYKIFIYFKIILYKFSFLC